MKLKAFMEKRDRKQKRKKLLSSKKNYSQPFSLFQYYNYCTVFRNFHFNGEKYTPLLK